MRSPVKILTFVAVLVAGCDAPTTAHLIYVAELPWQSDWRHVDPNGSVDPVHLEMDTSLRAIGANGTTRASYEIDFRFYLLHEYHGATGEDGPLLKRQGDIECYVIGRHDEGSLLAVEPPEWETWSAGVVMQPDGRQLVGKLVVCDY